MGGNGENMRRGDIQQLLEDFLSLSNIQRQQNQRVRFKHDFKFSSNKSFWSNAGEMFEGAKVTLEDFSVMEWAPLSPGRYHTAAAEQSRVKAMSNFAQNEYLLLGKLNMILGGVGSVRLSSERQSETIFHVIGASSTGVSHEGIPIRMQRADYRALISSIKETGSCDCTIHGELEIYSLNSGFDSPTGVPRYILSVKDFCVLREKSSRHALVSLSVMFLGANRGYEPESRASGKVGWSFICYDPSSKQPDSSLTSAVEWLKDYCSRHSVYDDPHIISDFDAGIQHFTDTAIFDLEDLLDNKIDTELLKRVLKRFDLTINIDQIGDRFEHVENSRIINRSRIAQ